MKRDLAKKSALLILAIVMCLSFCSCSSSKTEPKFGTWEGNTFKNESTNLTFTIDHTCIVLSPEQMKKSLNDLNQFSINGLDKNPDAATDNKKRHYILDSALFLKDQVSSIYLIYIELSSIESQVSEKSILQGIVKEMKKNDQQKIDIKFNKYGDAIIAGDEYKTAELEMSAEGKTTSFKFYLRIENGFAICFMTTSPTDDSSLRDEFMTRIQHIK